MQNNGPTVRTAGGTSAQAQAVTVGGFSLSYPARYKALVYGAIGVLIWKAIK